MGYSCGLGVDEIALPFVNDYDRRGFTYISARMWTRGDLSFYKLAMLVWRGSML